MLLDLLAMRRVVHLVWSVEGNATAASVGLFAEGIRQKTSWLTESEEAGAKLLSA